MLRINEMVKCLREYDISKVIQMDDDMFHSLGTFLIYLGMILLVVFLFSPRLWTVSIYTRTPPYRIDIFLLSYSLFLASSAVSIGFLIRRKYRQRHLYVTKVGESIHLARVWKKAPEEELFLTACELVVSTNEISERTTHSGYWLVTASQPTCGECSTRDGRRILAAMRYNREG